MAQISCMGTIWEHLSKKHGNRMGTDGKKRDGLGTEKLMKSSVLDEIARFNTRKCSIKRLVHCW